MIPQAAIVEWARVVPWSATGQVEQDLVLSRLIVEIANHPVLGDELVLRGGTCLHKVVLPEPLRNSEDLEYARVSRTAIGPLLDAIREIAGDLGMDVNTDVGTHPKVRLRAPFESGGGPMRVTVEIDTYETSPARPRRRAPHRVDTEWWAGSADVLTLQPEELAATLLRASFQRRQARDVFDLWVTLSVLGLDPAEIVACFEPYRPGGFTAERARQRLDRHLSDPRFRTELCGLLHEVAEGNGPDAVGSLVVAELLGIM